ncbi:Hypothetical predicted protein [Olea europaea subsp. europaea]|uniref:Zinc finger GRF-type domain-containing protein n=1 Tax=Olea europaea subsp. europaea TaxID=158383 RepID=A0A8S0PEN5_OLEEU|nr:Hypothetical predicted protein [Olea europaea subsp. europaea]
MRAPNFSVCHSCRSTEHYFRDCLIKIRCPWCPRGIQKCFEVAKDTDNQGRLFKTCSDNCGYFDWVQNEGSSGESSTINEAMNVMANKEIEDLPSMFDPLAVIAKKRGVEISMTLTFCNETRHAEECGKGKGPARHA